jgi:hypothetical protein
MSTGERFGRDEHARTLCLEALVAFFHDAEGGVALKVLGPHRDEHQRSISDLVMSVLYDDKRRGGRGGAKSEQFARGERGY